MGNIKMILFHVIFISLDKRTNSSENYNGVMKNLIVF